MIRSAVPPVGAISGLARLTRWLLQCICLPALVACAGLPGDDVPAISRPLEVGAGSAYFALSGRLSVREGQRVEIAGLRWERARTTESVSLHSPLGSTVAKLWKGEDGVARLVSGDRNATAVDLESLIHDALGAPVPLEALGWWIQGLQVDAANGTRRGTGDSFNHAGWDIRIEEFPLSAKAPVAKRIVARRGETTLRLVIDEWEPRP